MSKIVIRLISPRVLCTSIKNRVPSWFDRFIRLIKTVWTKMSQNSYLREFCAQGSQIVFLADLTVLWLITTVWVKLSENSSLREFCAQGSQIVFLADLTVLRLIRTVWAKMSKKLISPRVLCTSIKKSCFKLIWPFFRLLELYDQKCHKTHISASSVHKCHKSCF